MALFSLAASAMDGDSSQKITLSDAATMAKDKALQRVAKKPSLRDVFVQKKQQMRRWESPRVLELSAKTDSK